MVDIPFSVRLTAENLCYIHLYNVDSISLIVCIRYKPLYTKTKPKALIWETFSKNEFKHFLECFSFQRTHSIKLYWVFLVL